MSEGLWRDDLRCGCRKGAGHVCCPSWMTEAEWAGAPTHILRALSENAGKVITEGSAGASGAGTPPVIPRPSRPDLITAGEDDHVRG